MIAAAGVALGVDTHQRTHHAAVLDSAGRRLGDREFPATGAGYAALHRWAAGFGPIGAVGVESTGSYGAGLSRYLLTQGLRVNEVPRPEKTVRVYQGKSDAIDAYSAAQQVLSGRASGQAKLTTGLVEALRTLKIPRDGAVRDRTRAYSQLRDLVTTAPTELHDALIGLSSKQRVTRALAMRPDLSRIEDPVQATKVALQSLARRIRGLDAEIKTADAHITALVAEICPTLLALPQVGPQTSAQLVITAGENIDRMRSEATFAKLCGVAPLPASSGKHTRHRLNRGGDRKANCALHMIIVGRLARHEPTLAYLQRRRAEAKTDREIIRCLKRHLIRSIYSALRDDLMTP